MLILTVIAVENVFGKKSKENLLPTQTDDVRITYADIEELVVLAVLTPTEAAKIYSISTVFSYSGLTIVFIDRNSPK